MSDKQKTLSQSFLKQSLGGVVSINDLREREFNNEKLSEEEKTALRNFDRFRISELNKQSSDAAFHERYQELQIMANMGEYTEFLKEKYRS